MSEYLRIPYQNYTVSDSILYQQISVLPGTEEESLWPLSAAYIIALTAQRPQFGRLQAIGQCDQHYQRFRLPFIWPGVAQISQKKPSNQIALHSAIALQKEKKACVAQKRPPEDRLRLRCWLLGCSNCSKKTSEASTGHPSRMQQIL